MKQHLILLILLLISRNAVAKDIQYTFNVDGITCPFCVATSKKALGKIEGVKSVSANLEEGQIYVCADESVKFTDDEIKELFLEKGFIYKNMNISDKCHE